VQRAAADAGHRLGAAEALSAACSPTAAGGRICATLAEHGYGPRPQGDVVVLANCPFHALAREHTALVCGMNLHLITAMLDELGHPDVQTSPHPAPGRCCVRLTPINRPLGEACEADHHLTSTPEHR
jgi:predicted ArsR family transcriptional regulator